MAKNPKPKESAPMTMPKYDRGNKLDRIAGIVSRMPEFILNTPHNLLDLSRFICSLPGMPGRIYEDSEGSRPAGIICVRDLLKGSNDSQNPVASTEEMELKG